MSRYIIVDDYLNTLDWVRASDLFDDIEEAYDAAEPGQTVIRLEQEDTKVK